MTGSSGLASLKECSLPDFGMLQTDIELPDAVYEGRRARLIAAMEEHLLDAVVVYGDREHSANLCWLTGFDPRFEEALAIVSADGRVTLAVGNEGLDYSGVSRGVNQTLLWSQFSLPGQPRQANEGSLAGIFHDHGLQPGERVGLIGWKYRATSYGGSDPQWFEVPHFIVHDLESVVGRQSVLNATALLMHESSGLRSTCEVEQLAAFEAVATRSSQAFRDVLTGLGEGLTERDLVSRLHYEGLPLSCHMMASSGERTRFGLASPSAKPVRIGEPVVLAIGVQGALTCRAGVWARAASELRGDIADYVDKVVAPYFSTVARWYGALRVGAEGGTFWDIAVQGLPTPFFDRKLNPGHLIHLDEWMNSPIQPAGRTQLASGMYLQMDIIPRPSAPYPTTNVEDGVAIADAPLREAFAQQYPHAWKRVQQRRNFMAGSLGIELHPDVMPFGNMPGWLPPYWLSPQMAMAVN